MCGIGGIFWGKQQPRQELLEKGIQALSHRGPDMGGLYIDNNVGLLHSRLSIIDPNINSCQPFTDGESNPILIFNGEIFNYVQLRESLGRLGCVFKTNSDTEVLYFLLKVYGHNALSMLNGQFAFAYYDPLTEKLLLARDPFGEKPLFYSMSSMFCFGSELKVVACLRNESLKLDPVAVKSIVDLWAVLPTSSVCTDIMSIPPGSYLIKDPKSIVVEQYFTIPERGNGVQIKSEDLRAQIKRAVSSRMIADVPVGIYLSGGLDSSIIGYEAVRISERKLDSLSVSFENTNLDESSHQIEISGHLETNHHSLKISNADIVDNIEAAMFYAESPSPRSAFIPMFLLSQEARKKGIKVILTGEGADEVFLGYDLFRETLIKEAIRNGAQFDDVKKILQNLNSFIAGDGANNKYLALRFANYSKLSLLNHPLSSHSERINLGVTSHQFIKDVTGKSTCIWLEYLSGKYPNFLSRPEIERATLIEIETLLCGHLLSTQGDRASMANGVETRPPFLDIEFFNKIHTVDRNSFFDEEFGEKALLKRAYQGLLPNSILQRTKFPFRAPDSLAFCTKQGAMYVQDILHSHRSYESIFDVASFIKFFTNLNYEKLGPRDNHVFMTIFTGMVFERVFRYSSTFVKKAQFSVFNKIITKRGLILHLKYDP